MINSGKLLWQLFGPKLTHSILGISVGGGKEDSDFEEDTTQNVTKASDENKTTQSTQTKDATGTKNVQTIADILTQLFSSKASTSETSFDTVDKTESVSDALSQISQSTQGETTQTGQTTADKTATGNQTSQATDTTSQTVSGLETLSTLDDQTQSLLQGLLGDLASNGSSADIIAQLTERGLNAEDRLTGLVDPIVANARQKLETDLGQSQQAFARAAGSSQNTLVQQLGLEESVKVERELADLAATLGLQVDQQITGSQQSALGLTESLSGQLAEVLKGATQTGSTTQTTDVISKLEELVSSLQSENVTGTTVDKGTEVRSVTGDEKTTQTAAGTSAKTGSEKTAGTSTEQSTQQTQQTENQQIVDILSEVLASAGVETTNLAETIAAITNAKGKGKTSGASAGLNIGI